MDKHIVCVIYGNVRASSKLYYTHSTLRKPDMIYFFLTKKKNSSFILSSFFFLFRESGSSKTKMERNSHVFWPIHRAALEIVSLRTKSFAMAIRLMENRVAVYSLRSRARHQLSQGFYTYCSHIHTHATSLSLQKVVKKKINK